MTGETTPNFAVSIICAKVYNNNPNPKFSIDKFQVPDGLTDVSKQIIKDTILANANKIYKDLRDNTSITFPNFDVRITIATDVTFYPDGRCKLNHRTVFSSIEGF